MKFPEIKLNPKLDLERLNAAYRGEKRLHIPNILNGEAAEAVFNCLKNEIAWNLAYYDDKGQQDLFASKQKQMTPRDWQEFHRKIFTRARAGKFQYLYGSFAVGDLYQKKIIRDLFVSKFFEFLNTPEVFDFIKKITRIRGIRRASMQATAYGPGHFLTDHNDFDPSKDRKIAYVFNFTKEWKAEWGGLLQFLDEDGRQGLGLVPTFNALNIFAVPQRHIVTQVATYAPKVRYSLTGWFLGTAEPK